MPELQEAPDMKIQSNLNTDIDLGFSSRQAIEQAIPNKKINTIEESSSETQIQVTETNPSAETPIEEVPANPAEAIAEEKNTQSFRQNREQKPLEEMKNPSVTEEKNKEYKWRKIKDEPPQYPQRAYKNQKEGWVDVQLTINPEGNVVDTIAVASYNDQSLFNRSALNAVRKWKFEPPRTYGIEEPMTTQVRINFKL